MPENGCRILVVGGVAGGASAATRARRCNEHAEIVIYEKDGYVSFANCGLPYYLGGDISAREKLLVAKPSLFEQRFNIEVHVGHEITRILPGERRIEGLDRNSGATFSDNYDKLILAPGASPIVPDQSGARAKNVYVLRNVEDTDAIKAQLDQAQPKRAVIVGAGFIGLEMVEQFHQLGIQVVLVEMAPQILAPLDPEMAGIVEEALAAKDVERYLGAGLESFIGSDEFVTGVTLTDGTSLDCDMVILGMGVRPAVGLAKDAGLALGEYGGIAVNEYAQTSDPNIYAAGDAVEYPRTFSGSPMRIPLAGPANRAGRIAGEHAATGKARPMGVVQGSAIVRVFDCVAAATGLNEKTAARLGVKVASVVAIGAHHAGYYPGATRIVLKLVFDPVTGKLLGAQAVGGDGVDKRIDVIATALQFGATVGDLATLDLCYAPLFGSAKDPIHMAAFIACNHLDGLSPIKAPADDFADVQLVDVRNDAEVATMRLPNSIHIPVDQLRERIGELDSSKPTVVHCHSGLRSHIATRMMKEHGFADVMNVTGGIFLQQYARPDRILRD